MCDEVGLSYLGTSLSRFDQGLFISCIRLWSKRFGSRNMASAVRFDGTRLNEAKAILHDKQGRATIVLRLLDDPPWIDTEALEEFIADMKRGDGKCDFFIIQLIRLLYVLRSKPVSTEVQSWISRLIAAMVISPYFPHTNGPIPLHSPHSCVPPSDGIVFWSENHIFMLLSSAYLLRQYLYETNQAHLLLTVTDREEQLLLSYLSTHVQFGGVYEVLSHVYLPYTISSLLNLIDFAPAGCVIQQHAHTLLHRIVYQILLCTTASNGICCLTASNRAYERTRERTHGHNINQLIRLLVGQSPDPYDDTALIDFLLTTSWQPTIHELEELNQAYAFEGYTHMTMNHSVKELGLCIDAKKQSALYDTISPSERAPFYWSAGLITHSSFIRDTLTYQQQKGLQKNVHLWPLRFLPSMWSEHLLSRFRHFAHGQCYTGMSLNVYKKRSLLLTSLEYLEQEGLCGYQQLPWIANVGGIGVWTQSGGHDNHDKTVKGEENRDKGMDVSSDDVEVLIKNHVVSTTNLIATTTKSSTTSTASSSSSSQQRRTRNGICNWKRLRLHIPATHTHAPYVSQKGPYKGTTFSTPPVKYLRFHVFSAIVSISVVFQQVLFSLSLTPILQSFVESLAI